MTVSSNLLSLIYTETLFFYHCYVIAWSNFAACLDWKKYDHVFWYYRRIQLIALKSQNILTRLIIKHLRKYLINNFKKYRILLFEMMPVCLYLQSRNICRNFLGWWSMHWPCCFYWLWSSRVLVTSEIERWGERDLMWPGGGRGCRGSRGRARGLVMVGRLGRARLTV